MLYTTQENKLQAETGRGVYHIMSAEKIWGLKSCIWTLKVAVLYLLEKLNIHHLIMTIHLRKQFMASS